MRPLLLTFDVFGTLIDWQTGLSAALAEQHHQLTDKDFERVLAAQEADEAGTFQPYAEIMAASLQRALGLSADEAKAVAEGIGKWPLFPDARDALRRLKGVAQVVAMTNSDCVNGEQVQVQLGFPLTDWVCAEQVKVYKPALAFWQKVSDRLGVAPGPQWWHASAYADYDLKPAKEFKLTTVFVQRPHCRPGAADLQVADLTELADRAEKES